jgi:hypothetical protein
MSNLEPLTKSEIQQLVDEFYAKLDAHAPVEEYIDLFAFGKEDFIMKFPSITLTSWEEFKPWYIGTLNEFFDEIHAAEKIEFTANTEQADK